MQEYPEELNEALAGVLKLDPKPHQKATIAYIRTEEAAQAGLQRSIWMKATLPNAPDLVAYISPVFDALWLANDAAHIHNRDSVLNKSARYSFQHELHGASGHRLSCLNVYTGNAPLL